MEDWQRNHIKANLPELLKTMRCSSALLATLLQNQTISFSDQEDINSYRTNDDKCDCLLRILLTRTKAYEGLLLALENTCQNGAVGILKSAGLKRSTSMEENPRAGNSGKSSSSVHDLQDKWEHSLLKNNHLFLSDNVSEDAIKQHTQSFYSEIIAPIIPNSVFTDSLEKVELQKQISASLMKGFLKVATDAPNFLKVSQILTESIQNIEKRYFRERKDSHLSTDSPAIGIDLGTCNLCVAVYINGKVKVIENNVGEKTTPSYVAFYDNGSETVGKTARKKAFMNSEYTIYDAKRVIGRHFNDPSLQYDRKKWPFKLVADKGVPSIVTPHTTLSAVEISAKLLQECVKQAENELQQKITKAVITVPAYFNDSQVKATKKAGDKAGLTVLKLLKEPTAAAITYRQERNYNIAKRVLIFDLGGGTNSEIASSRPTLQK